MFEEDALFNIARDIRESLETPEKKSIEILVPSFIAGIKLSDFETFYQIRNKKIKLKAVNSKTKFKQSGNWFINQNQSAESLKSIPETQVLLDPRTGYIIEGIEDIDYTVETWRTGSGHEMPWGGGSSIGRLHTLSKKDFDRFGNNDDKIGEYFIKTDKGEKIILGKGNPISDAPKIGDHMIAVSLSGDNFFDFQLLRPNPKNAYELRGVYFKPNKKQPEKAFIIGSYHLGQNVSPINITLKTIINNY